jgi:hypothetical protein
LAFARSLVPHDAHARPAFIQVPPISGVQLPRLANNRTPAGAQGAFERSRHFR